MSSSQPGTPTSPEVTNISQHGFWLLAHGEELFLPFDEFPWFREATVKAILEVEEPSPGHFHWPALDVDVGLDTIRNPEKYPLSARVDA
jgi:hypothetical protein